MSWWQAFVNHSAPMSNLSKNLTNLLSTVKLVAKGPPARGGAGEDASASVTPTPPEQARIFSRLGPQVMSPTQLNKLVAGYIVEDMLPLSTIESSRFRKILSKIPVFWMPPQDRKTFYSYLDKCYSDMESQLGMTAHWINRITLKREKAAIAWIRGRHTYDVIAGEIEQVHSAYGLTNIVIACVTDNRSNFVKGLQNVWACPTWWVWFWGGPIWWWSCPLSTE